MNDNLKMLFIDNPGIEEAIKEFCSQNPEYLKLKQEFYETAQQIAGMIGWELYDRFEKRFSLYIASSNDIYYLFGLGLRQEVLSALQPEMP